MYKRQTGGTDGNTPTIADRSQLSALGQQYYRDIVSSSRYPRSAEDQYAAMESIFNRITQDYNAGHLTLAEKNYLASLWGVN